MDPSAPLTIKQLLTLGQMPSARPPETLPISPRKQTLKSNMQNLLAKYQTTALSVSHKNRRPRKIDASLSAKVHSAHISRTNELGHLTTKGDYQSSYRSSVSCDSLKAHAVLGGFIGESSWSKRDESCELQAAVPTGINVVTESSYRTGVTKRNEAKKIDTSRNSIISKKLVAPALTAAYYSVTTGKRPHRKESAQGAYF